MRTSLKYIAEQLKISKTTVSWVLSGKGNEKGISIATQEKVLRYAKSLNYQPNLLARSLNTGVSGTIGLIIPDISDLFYSQVAREIECEAEKLGYSLMICSSESKIERENKMIRLFKAKQVDGIILAPTKHSKSEIEQLQQDAFPFVLFDRYFPEMQTNYLIIDNESSSYQLTKHLISQGRKKIVILTTNSHLTTMNLRTQGYKRAIEEAGLEWEPGLYGYVDFIDYENNIIQTLDTIFEKVKDVDAFFFATHILALEAFCYFANKHIDINKYFGLACMHEVSTFKVLAPKMNIARMPIEEIGQHAVRILHENIMSKQHKSSYDVYSEKLSCTLKLYE